MIEPDKPDPGPQSEPSADYLDSLPHNLPDEARDLYMAAFQNAIREHGNRPEIAHHAGMSAVMEHFDQDESGGWHRKDG
ncbi:MAG TPA: hypothetical protein GYA06_03540 [Chloroflexi bacterium]|nr:hypothetical protein [Chloroflexota bacterium]